MEMCRRYVKQSESWEQRGRETLRCMCVDRDTEDGCEEVDEDVPRTKQSSLTERTLQLSRQLIREVWCRGHLQRVWQSKLEEVLGGQQPAEEEDVTPNWKAWVKKTAKNAREVVTSQSAAVVQQTVTTAGLSEGWNRGVKRREGPEGAGA